ncbi:M24 family metallopeptidase [Leifsonia shinshuensis]|uniref:M24 family metallopeptidase n=1 Tax=Leifsonia shinshuensis TaxID=150026 RepID=UPI001F509567|nr:M24 family metallopeptidase [Leifsonia shinshuensis]MCI0156496.1 M24 family metallopeptidase [Leifsonia shinshuensis]
MTLDYTLDRAVGTDLPFPLEEYHDRWERTLLAMRDADLPALVVWQKSGGSFDRAGDVYWLTNYASIASGQEPPLPGVGAGRAHAAVLLRPGHEPEVHTVDGAASTDPAQVATGAVHSHFDLGEGLAQRMNDLGLEGRVGYVGDNFLPVQIHRALTERTPQIEWVAVDDLLVRVQMHKSPRERDVFREAGVIASRSMDALMTALIAGKPESEAAAMAAAEVYRAGGGIQRVAIDHGQHSEHFMWSSPMYGHRPVAPREGDMLRGWIYGPILHGYWLDPGRTAVCGNRPTSAQRRLVEDSLSIHNAIIDAFRPGATAAEIGAYGDRLVEQSDFAVADASQWDVYGHGLGTFFQAPVVPAGGEAPAAAFIHEPIREGSVMTVEVFFNTPGVGSATWEDVFIVGADGNEMLSTSPQLYW